MVVNDPLRTWIVCLYKVTFLRIRSHGNTLLNPYLGICGVYLFTFSNQLKLI